MPSTHKKVIVRKQDRDSVSGYVAPSNFVVEGKLELLNTSGNVVAIDLRDIKAVYFVREFSDTDLMLRKTFTTRPRTEGLWVRLKLKHAASLRPSGSAKLGHGLSGNRRSQPPPQRRPTRHQAGNPVRAVENQVPGVRFQV